MKLKKRDTARKITVPVKEKRQVMTPFTRKRFIQDNIDKIIHEEIENDNEAI